jgi:amidase
VEDWSGRSLAQLHQALISGDVTSVELTRSVLDDVSSRSPHIGALVHVDPDYALARAEEIDRGGYSAKGSVLRGVPTADKDLVRRAGMPTHYGSRTRQARELDVESDEMALWVDAVGAVSVGKTATSEFGMAGYTEPLLGGPVTHPLHPTRQVGGSSGGAAAAVAAGFFAFAPGSDGGGSIRIPALACGIVGWKPSRGLIPAGSGLESPGGLSVPGLLTRTVSDLSLAAPELLRGDWDWATQSTSGDDSPPTRVGVTTRSPWPQEWGIAPDEDSRAALERAQEALGSLGLDVVEIEWEPDESYHEHFLTLWAVTAAAIDVERDQDHLLEPLTLYLRKKAENISGVDFSRTLVRLKEFERATIRAFSGVDAVLTPGLATAPPKVGFFDSDPEANFRQQIEFTPWTSFVNVSGLPAVVLPVWENSESIQMGVQLIGRPGADLGLIELARSLERALQPGD